ncbi:receptor/non-receptor type protein-tyrosine phosphatase [Backusella circina FSU 941]|nr:receptor/non-receptor type protein-tyrosine phosphatase [Backusella circina FSU 941]
MVTKNSTLNTLLQDQNTFSDYANAQFARLNHREKQQKTSGFTHNEAREHESRNRYYDITPFDNNCVEFTNGQLGSNSYINASWITPPLDIPVQYIATQGPIPSTIFDFWRTIVEYQVPVIVCLTPEYENQLDKCACYWPIGDKALEIASEAVTLSVKNIKQERMDHASNSLVRTLSVEFTRKGTTLISTQVNQLHFQGWPDHGVPSQTDQVIGLIKLSRQLRVQNKPILVHCSAGCGRTGTFCVVDSAELYLKENPEIELDLVFALTDDFRSQRTNMVQDLAQYEFCYRVLMDILE